MVKRRDFGRAVAGLFALGISGGYSYAASRPALAASGQRDWVAEGATITATDGSVDKLTFGDAGNEDDELHLSWSGLNAEARSVNFRILLKGVDDGDDVGWNGGDAGAETEYEELARAEPGIELDSTGGSTDYSWEAVFGEEQPVDVDEHSEIDVTGDFAEAHDGETRERELAVDVEVWTDEESGRYGPDGNALGDRKRATATISVTHEDSPETVEDLFAEISQTHGRHTDRPREIRISYQVDGPQDMTFWARDADGDEDEETVCAVDDGEIFLGDPWRGNNSGDVEVEVNVHDGACYRAVLSYDDQRDEWETAEWDEDWSETCEGATERDEEC